jgi:hypothetical protein
MKRLLPGAVGTARNVETVMKIQQKVCVMSVMQRKIVMRESAATPVAIPITNNIAPSWFSVI